MSTDGARVLGGSGPAVLLIPGGAEASDGFFPGLPEGLLDDPGCRVILYDRPGAGTSSQDGSLAESADHIAATIAELGCRPVVAVDRLPHNTIRTAHARLAAALGAPLMSWPGAQHNLQLDHPEETLATVRDVVP